MQVFTVRAGAALILVGVVLVIGGLTAVGEARSWDRADALAEDSRHTLRRAGMLMGATGLAALLAVSPVVVARLHGTAGFGLAVAGWVGYAIGAGLFLMVLGLTNIAFPALGERAARGEVSPERVADAFVRQPAIGLAFIGGNAVFLSWILIGMGLTRSGVFSAWVGWSVMAGSAAGWLSFLHVPGFQQVGAPLRPASIVLLGAQMLLLGRHPT